MPLKILFDDTGRDFRQHVHYGALFKDHLDNWSAADGFVGTAVQCELASLIFPSF
jgi:hypothetical protein